MKFDLGCLLCPLDLPLLTFCSISSVFYTYIIYFDILRKTDWSFLVAFSTWGGLLNFNLPHHFSTFNGKLCCYKAMKSQWNRISPNKAIDINLIKIRLRQWQWQWGFLTKPSGKSIPFCNSLSPLSEQLQVYKCVHWPDQSVFSHYNLIAVRLVRYFVKLEIPKIFGNIFTHCEITRRYLVLSTCWA